jgi:cation transport ATPase
MNVLCSVRPSPEGHFPFFVRMLISAQEKTGTLTQNKMHVEDAAIYDVPFDVPTLRQQLELAEDLVSENLRQLPAVSAICNAASFEGSPSDSKRKIIGDATGKGPIRCQVSTEKRASLLTPSLLLLTRFGDPEVLPRPYF